MIPQLLLLALVGGVGFAALNLASLLRDEADRPRLAAAGVVFGAVLASVGLVGLL